MKPTFNPAFFASQAIKYASTKCIATNLPVKFSSFMGLSFSVGGWGQSRHFTGLDRPSQTQQVERSK